METLGTHQHDLPQSKIAYYKGRPIDNLSRKELKEALEDEELEEAMVEIVCLALEGFVVRENNG